MLCDRKQPCTIQWWERGWLCIKRFYFIFTDPKNDKMLSGHPFIFYPIKFVIKENFSHLWIEMSQRQPVLQALRWLRCIVVMKGKPWIGASPVPENAEVVDPRRQQKQTFAPLRCSHQWLNYGASWRLWWCWWQLSVLEWGPLNGHMFTMLICKLVREEQLVTLPFVLRGCRWRVSQS